MAQRKYAEIGVEEFDAMPTITDTNTVEKWREWARDKNMLVKQKSDTTKSADNGEIQIEPCTADTDIPIGILRSVVGDPSAFPKKFMASIAVRALDCNLDGAATGALVDDDFGKRIKPDSEGRGTIVDTGGVGRVVGGTKQNLRIAFDFIDNFR